VLLSFVPVPAALVLVRDLLDSLPTISMMIWYDSPHRLPISGSGAAGPVGRLLSVASVHDEVMKIRHVSEHRDEGACPSP
jgi:hypothetical protein